MFGLLSGETEFVGLHQANYSLGQRENQASRTTNEVVDKLAANMEKTDAIKV